MLIRNLTDLIVPFGGYDVLPSDTETTPASDLARIKHYRNFVARAVGSMIDAAFYNKAWSDITGVCIALKTLIFKV